MTFTLSNNPFIRLQVAFMNFREKNIEKRWRKSPHKCTCHVCGKTITEKDYSPASSGWMRLKGEIYNPWVCHRCLEHHNELFRPRTDEERDEYLKEVHKVNEKMRKQWKEEYQNYVNKTTDENNNENNKRYCACDDCWNLENCKDKSKYRIFCLERYHKYKCSECKNTECVNRSLGIGEAYVFCSGYIE